MEEAAIVFQNDLTALVYNRAAVEFLGPPPAANGFSQWEQACGFHAENAFGNALEEPCAVEDLPWRRILRGEKWQPTAYLLRNRQHPAGIWVLVRAHPQLDERGAVAAVISIRNTTARRMAELSRAQWQTSFHEFMRYLPGVAFIKGHSGQYLFFSESSLKTTGLQAEDVIGKTDAEIWPTEFTEEWRKNDLEVLAQGKSICFTESLPTEAGVQKWTVYKFPIPNERGERVLVGGIGVDDHEWLQLENRLRQAEKMEAIGRLAGGVAHDFNNLLTVISGYGQMLQEALARDLPKAKMSTYLEELLGAGARAVNLTDQLLAFSRRKVSRRLRLDLREHLKELERMLARVIGEKIDLRVEDSDDACYVQADPAQLTQVILNLAVNAKDSMPQGGVLTMRTGFTSKPPEDLPEPSYVLLEVADTGRGTDKETLAHIFEPFFASKSHGKGTGLGLSTVYGIVKQTGGEIAVTSEPEAGTTFRVYLPAADGAAPAEKAEAKAPRPASTGEETILLVEDDATVRNLVRTMLESFGYRPLAADSGKRALEIFAQKRGEIDLLLTDVIMPQMSGRELAVALKRAEPNLKVLYMSGYTANEMAVQGLANARPMLLQKPFNAEALARRVREALDMPPQPH